MRLKVDVDFRHLYYSCRVKYFSLVVYPFFEL